MRIIASIKKSANVRFTSHLDVQRMLQRTVRRAGIPVAFSQGFNPHPLISFATALAVGQTGECEWIDVRLERDIELSDFVKLMNSNFPEGFSITAARVAKEGTPSLATLMVWAEYTVHTDNAAVDRQTLEEEIAKMMQGQIVIKKHKKQNGRKLMDAEVDIRPMVYDFRVARHDSNGIDLYIKGRQDSSGGLNAELLVNALNSRLGLDIPWLVHRKHVELTEK